MADDADTIAGMDWPTFGWSDDIRPALGEALAAGNAVVLATLYRVEGSAPRGPGAQMLFHGGQASGYFSGDCIEGDVARHAAEVLADGQPQSLHYGLGSPWIDIRLRCGGALYILVERITADCPAARQLLSMAEQRRSCLYSSDGTSRTVTESVGDGGENPLLCVTQQGPLRVSRRYDPPRRIVVSGGDPGALALAKLAADAQFETILVRPDGPELPPPIEQMRYLREEPASALAHLCVDRWTGFIGATHEDHHDLAACLHALRHGAGYVGMIGARSRAAGRIEALKAAGANREELDRLHLSPGIAGLGKAPWEVAIGIMAEIMQALNPSQDRA